MGARRRRMNRSAFPWDDTSQKGREQAYRFRPFRFPYLATWLSKELHDFLHVLPDWTLFCSKSENFRHVDIFICIKFDLKLYFAIMEYFL